MGLRNRRALLLTTVMGGGAAPIVYSLRDLFTTDLAAGSVNGTNAEPGPGTRVVYDATGAQVSLTSGVASIKGNVGWGSGGLWLSEAIARTMGKMLLARIKIAVGGSYSSEFGLDADTASRITLELLTTSVTDITSGGVTGDFVTLGASYDIAIILRTRGAYYLIRGGTEYPTWTLIGVSYADVTAALYFGFQTYHVGTFSLYPPRVTQCLAPYITDRAIATTHAASVTENDTTTHTADGMLEFTWAAVTGETLDIQFRRTDDDNCWIVRLVQADAKIYLFEKTAGSETERGATGGTAQTLTNGTKYRIFIKFFGQKIYVFTAAETGALAQKVTYASAAFNATATGGKVTKNGTNLTAWPRTLTGSALSEVTRISGPFLGTDAVLSTVLYSSSIEA